MKHILFILFFTAGTCAAQVTVAKDTITLDRQQAEALFLEKNIALLAGRLDMDIAEAQVVQAKLWPNPTLTVSEINLWSNATAEKLPPLWRNFGTTSEVAVSLEQIIITAGKRRKMISMEKVSADMAKEYFSEMLRNLKLEFRNTMTDLQLTQLQQKIYKKQVSSIQVLTAAYAKQVQQGNTASAEYTRLKAAEIQFLRDLSELDRENNRLQKELKVLMSLPSSSYIKLSDDGFAPDLADIARLQLSLLIEQALENRPDVKSAKLASLYSNEKYKYERALRTPDITLQASYDRGGNIMNNFVGFGFAIDLPFFNRNQGNIKAARASIKQSELLVEQKTITVQAEVIEAYSNLQASLQLYSEFSNGLEGELDKLLDSYFRSFRQRDTSLILYLDYVNAYIENKAIILNTRKNISAQYEELKYITGQEL
ncbi:TolC family protein [Flavobacterium sp.]|uniref:TolC family protein n=1 Tax=Flavobacterium sp. TaxID=239 RepID=UPI004033713F